MWVTGGFRTLDLLGHNQTWYPSTTATISC